MHPIGGAADYPIQTKVWLFCALFAQISGPAPCASDQSREGKP